MSSNNNNRNNGPAPDLGNGKKPNGKNYASTYIKLVVGMVGAFVVLLVIGGLAYSAVTDSKGSAPKPHTEVSDAALDDSNKPAGNIISNLLEAPDKTNFLVAGTDAGRLLTDVIMVGCFDKNTMKIDVISVPRDTYTKMSQEDVNSLRSAGRYPPSSGVMKMNAVHSYSGRETGMLYLKKQLETTLGIEIEYYALIDLAAFRNIVDAVGGIYMEIPKGGLYYSDPEQNLTIAVPEGMQHLDGAMAEGVVRYRDKYPGGDLQRIGVQQEFMKQFFSQMLSKESIVNNALSIITTVLSYTETNFGIDDVPKYLKYARDISPEKFETHMLPGNGTSINGGSYFIIDEDATKDLVQSIFYSDNSPDDNQSVSSGNQTSEKVTDVKKMKIQILNATGQSGLAAEKRNQLNGAGYNVINVGTYEGENKENTYIMVKQSGNYDGLASFYPDCVIQTDSSISDKYDIIIVLGEDSLEAAES